MLIKRVDFETIKPIWETQLWPDRISPVESHSAMTWPGTSKSKHDMAIFNYPAYHWAVYINEQIVGVNSGHLTSDTEFRSRGLWVHPDFRRQGIAHTLFVMLKTQAKNSKANLIWSIPRETALPVYTDFGFTTIGQFFKTETSENNIYAFIRLEG